MGKIFQTIINDFSGGIVNDPRDTAEGVASMVTNFDILTDQHRMLPYRDSEDGGPTSVSDDKVNFCIGLWTATNPDQWRIFALGVTTAGGGIAEVAMKLVETTGGGNGDLADNTWLAPAANASGSGTMSPNFFVYYHRTGKIYVARAGTIAAFTPDNSTAWDDAAFSAAFTEIGQGLVHSKDNILYLPRFNDVGGANAKSFITSYNGTSATAAALTLPDHLIPVTICEYGNYIAIGCAPASGIGNSVVYLWDRDSSLATLSESIDWGEGRIRVLEEVDGLLLGISMIGGVGGATLTTFNDQIIFRYLSGNKAIKFKTLRGSTSSQLPIAKQKIHNRLYFMMSITIHGALREGVWSIGRSAPDGPISLVHERTPNNNTALSSGTLNNFFVIGDYMFISYISSSTYGLSKTNDQSSFTATSIYESKILNGGDSSVTKKLLGVTVMTQPLPAAGQVVLSYKIDENISGSTFTTIFTNTTDDSISRTAVNIESSGANLPEYKELVLRIASTGGAVVTGLKLQYEIISKDLLD